MMQSAMSHAARKMKTLLSGGVVSEDDIMEVMATLMNCQGNDFLSMLPMTLMLQGRPMNVAKRRPLFAPLFRKERRSRREIYLCGRQVSKALDVETPIPVPDGWTTMGNIRTGDFVLGSDGRPTRVVGATDVMHDHPCYEICFDNDEAITADAGHLWQVSIGTDGVSGQILVTTEWMMVLLGEGPVHVLSKAGPEPRIHHVTSIRPVPSVPVRCIKVDAHDSLFLCGRSMIPTHNTTSAAASMLMNLIWRVMFRILYVAPLSIYTHRLHHIHFSSMIRSCRLPFPIQDKSCVNNVNEKTFLSGSHFHGVSCFNSASNAIGLAIDSIIFDETQDLNLDFIPQIRETTKTSDFGWESYFGTARGIENTIQVLFDESSKGEWFVKCGRCGLWVEPTYEKHAISMIQKHGVACPDCKTLLNVESGQWVHEHPSRLEDKQSVGFAGYHIPATVIKDLINPYDRYLRTIYDRLYGVSKYSEARFLQEILGISSDQGGRPLSPEEIRRASVLDIEEDGTGINLDKYLGVGGGQDWGGSEVTSFTVSTAVGWTSNGIFECLGAYRPTGIPDNERHIPAAAWHRRVGGDRMAAIGADAGFVGSVQNKNLARVSGIPVASIGYGTQKNFFKPLPGNNFVVDRTTLIYIAYTLIKDQMVLFPKGEWFETFTEDLKATYIEDIESPTGISSRRYCRYSQKADDFLHALGYAIFACAMTSSLDLPNLVGIGENASLSARTEQQLDEIGEEGEAIFVAFR